MKYAVPYIHLAMLICISGCSCDRPDDRGYPPEPSRDVTYDSGPIPITQISDFLTNNDSLTDNEIKLILDNIDHDTYTYVRITKYRYDKTDMLDIDTFCVHEVYYNDDIERDIVSASFGTIYTYKQVDDIWQLIGGTHYD